MNIKPAVQKDSRFNTQKTWTKKMPSVP